MKTELFDEFNGQTIIKEELRIGNFLNNDSRNFNGTIEQWEVKSIGFDKAVVQNQRGQKVFKYNVLSGIPLTEDWLLKFQFEKVSDVYGGFLSLPNKYGERVRIRIITTSKGYFYTPSSQSNPIYISYVHELQNLYFALTKIELKIKDPTYDNKEMRSL